MLRVANHKNYSIKKQPQLCGVVAFIIEHQSEQSGPFDRRAFLSFL